MAVIRLCTPAAKQNKTKQTVRTSACDQLVCLSCSIIWNSVPVV